MPGMGGREILRWARQQAGFNRVTIALLTDSDAPRDIERGYEDGADRYLIKHPVAEVLIQIVGDAMQRLAGE